MPPPLAALLPLQRCTASGLIEGPGRLAQRQPAQPQPSLRARQAKHQSVCALTVTTIKDLQSTTTCSGQCSVVVRRCWHVRCKRAAIVRSAHHMYAAGSIAADPTAGASPSPLLLSPLQPSLAGCSAISVRPVKRLQGFAKCSGGC